MIIWSNYNGQGFPKLHTKFRGNRPAGSGGEDFLRVFTIYGHGGHLGHMTNIISTDFIFHVPKSLHTKFGRLGQVFLRKTCFNFHT